MPARLLAAEPGTLEAELLEQGFRLSANGTARASLAGHGHAIDHRPPLWR